MIKPSSISVCFQSNPWLKTQGNTTKKIPKNPIPSRANKEKINTFVAIFPTSKPKYVLIVLLDEPKPNTEYVYYYRDGRPPYKGNWRNTAGWTSVEVAGKIIEKIGPILATKYVELD